LAALAALPPANGYVGIDLILGDATDGSQDVVIEINPRLTTSYVALRQHYRTNLAAAMLQVIAGQPCELEIAQDVVSFRVK
jgi:predicted ATP-grasp superfamily ATP-dependent carboligase